MKLRNKKTGEITEVIVGGYPVSGKTKMWECSEMDLNEESGYKILGTYTSLAELNEEWEDYDESKEYWCIDWTGGINHITVLDDMDEYEENKKQIGNYFETQEEAEQAVEKLKAWKRLQDAGVTFQAKVIDYKWYLMPKTNDESVTFKEAHQLYKDIDLVFGVKYNEGDS